MNVSKQSINLIYAWRLTKEKGFDLLLQFIKSIETNLKSDKNSTHKELSEKIHIHIFGDGELKDQIPSVSFITYHGHLPKEQIIPIWKTCQYTIMPSQFLETFGLTALDSLWLWIPVIAYPKWALLQFLTPETSLSYWQDFDTILTDILQNFDSKTWQELSIRCLERFQHYTKKKRIARFRELSGLKTGTILLISDYIVDIGGIESFIINAKALLEENGYKVFLIWSSLKRTAIQRFRSLRTTLYNTSQTNKLKYMVRTTEPDLLRRHSVHRQLGRLPLKSMKKFKGQQRVMYHDFGLFHPYPSRVYDEQQLYYGRGLIQFLLAAKRSPGMTHSRRLLSLGLLKLKRMTISLIRKLLRKQIDLHLVPSEYMERIVHFRYRNKKINVETMSHFG